MLVVEVIAGVLFIASSGLLFNERFRRNRYLVGLAAIIGLVSTYFLTEQLIDRMLTQRMEQQTASNPNSRSTPPAGPAADSIPGPSAPAATPVLPQAPPADPNRVVLDFDTVRTNYPPDYAIAAAPILHAAPIAIDVTVVSPDDSRIVLRNNIGLYDGRAVQPTVSQNFLSQMHVARDAPSSFRLHLAEPVESVSFLIPAIFPASESGVTFPAWRATAYAPSGRAVSTVSEALARRFADAGAQSYTLRAPDFEGIQEVEFVSDWRQNGVPFAGFEAILIEQIVVQRRAKQ